MLIKKYDDGKFTSKFLDFSSSNTFGKNILVSEPRGLGLSLDTIDSTKIVLFAGGTGLYPYCDFIDLLYKSMLVSQKHDSAKKLLQGDPILGSNPFNNLSIDIYAAVNELS